MLGLKFSRLVHASLATGTLALSGCVDRAYNFGDSGSFGENPDDDSGSGSDTNNPNPNPTNNPDPTTDPVPTPPPDVPGPPVLIAADFADNLTLALTFSEAVAPPSAVDPSQFRLSAGFAPQGKYYEYNYGTFYQEPGIWNGAGYYCEEYCYEYCYMDECYERCWEYCYTPPGPPVRVAAINTLPDRPDILLLTLDNGIGGGVCNQLENYPDPWVADLFIHYTPQGAAPVTDNAGEPLPPYGEHWALSPDTEWEYLYEGFFPYMPQPLVPIACPF